MPSPRRSPRWKLTPTTGPSCSRSPRSWNRFVRRGDVHRFRLPKGVSHEQHGARYGVIVQADAMLPRSVVLVAPTSLSARPASFRPEVSIAGQDTRVRVEQVGAVDVERLGRHVGHLTAPELWAVDDALAVVLGLD